MEVKAQLRHLRISPRKVRRIADLIRNFNVEDARLQLEQLPHRSAGPLKKLIDSAISNAKHNLGVESDSLYIKKLTVDGGQTLKRYRPGPHGRAMPIAKRTAHITLVLDEGKKSSFISKQVKAVLPKKTQIQDHIKESVQTTEKSKAEKDQIKKPKRDSVKGASLGSRVSQIGRRMFQRKAIG
ncbi:50S ribosomal protein L22 [Candidatus Parcubacteria bacterium]|nr:MAG: 50S ribosomal protein L22 [Candidatus Parcubacteria bacterium]